jgi:hypothetical protein
LREFIFGHACHLESVLREHLVELRERVELLPGADERVFFDRTPTSLPARVLVSDLSRVIPTVILPPSSPLGLSNQDQNHLFSDSPR